MDKKNRRVILIKTGIILIRRLNRICLNSTRVCNLKNSFNKIKLRDTPNFFDNIKNTVDIAFSQNAFLPE